MPVEWLEWIGDDKFIGEGQLPPLARDEAYLVWDGPTVIQALTWDGVSGVSTLLIWEV